MIRFACPHCQSMLTVAPEHIGQQAKCQKCGLLLRVPKPPTAILLPPAPTVKNDLNRSNVPPLVLSSSLAAAIPTDKDDPNRSHVFAFTRRKLAICLMIGLLCCGGGGYLIFSFSNLAGSMSCEEAQSALWQATPNEVRMKLGRPDQIAEALIGDNDPGRGAWIYKNRLRDQKTGNLLPEVIIWFAHGKVSLIVCTPLHEMPRPPAGGGAPGFQ
jgi:hypothetical protein